MPVASDNKFILIPGGESVVVADNGTEIKLLYDGQVYDVVKFKDGKTSTPPANHPWRRTAARRKKV